MTDITSKIFENIQNGTSSKEPEAIQNGISLKVPEVVQSGISGCFSGNNCSNNTTNHYHGVQAPSRVPETFGELVADPSWGVSPPEIDCDYLRYKCDQPDHGTGKWIFEEAVYRGWRESKESKLLWLCGGPGTGKTMLAKRVAAEFLTPPGDPPEGVRLAFHFVSPELPTDGISVDETELLKLGLAKVARDLLYSILQQDRDLFEGCKTELRKQRENFFTNPRSLWRVLKEVIRGSHTDPIYILIDGIDSLKVGLCKGLMEEILGLAKIPGVKIFLSSRVVPHVSNNLSRHMKINLDGNDFVKDDVGTFIKRRVNALGEWDSGLKKRVREALLVKAGGIFLWASLAIENLACHSSGYDFDTFLEEFPSELNGVYQEMLRPLSKHGGSKGVLGMIECVALALRPLTFGEFGHIMVCKKGKAKTEQRSTRGGESTEIRPTEKEIESAILSSLGFLRGVAGTVSIVHHTAVEYLFNEMRKDNLPVLSKSEVHFTMSWECFQHLDLAFADHGRQRVEARSPCIKYAAESWFIHARRSIEISIDSFHNDPAHNWLQYQFFGSSDIVRKPWIELCGDPEMKILAGDQEPVHIAVSLGLMPLVEKALPDLTEPTDSNRSLLHLAAKSMSQAYGILIDKGGLSFLTAPDPGGNTPLHEAAIVGHWPMLKRLVERLEKLEKPGDGVHSKAIDRGNSSGNTPLHLAFQFDHPEIAKFLVERGANKTIRNGAGLTALELGETLGRREILDVLEGAVETRDQQATSQPSPQTPSQPPQQPPLQNYPKPPPPALLQAPLLDPLQAPRPAQTTDRLRGRNRLLCALSAICVLVAICVSGAIYSVAIALSRKKTYLTHQEEGRGYSALAVQQERRAFAQARNLLSQLFN